MPHGPPQLPPGARLPAVVSGATGQYLYDPAGRCWRVHCVDPVEGRPGRYRTHRGHYAWQATHRLFVAADGARRVYQLDSLDDPSLNRALVWWAFTHSEPVP